MGFSLILAFVAVGDDMDYIISKAACLKVVLENTFVSYPGSSMQLNTVPTWAMPIGHDHPTAGTTCSKLKS